MTIFSNRGISTIAAALTLLVLAAMGGAITYLVAAGSVGRANQVDSAQALYVTQAGIEYAIKRVYDQQSEIVNPPGFPFANGSFTISRSGMTLTITGIVGNATRAHKVDSPTEADCTTIDTSNINLTQGGKRIQGVNFRKVCLATTTVDKMQLSWVPNNGEKIKEIKIENLIVYTNPPGASSGTLLEIADYTMTNGNNNVINWFEFSADMEEKTVTLSFTMGDGSIKTTTFETED